VKFRFVQENRETFRVGSVCRVLKVSRSGYYAWLSRQPSLRDRDNERLTVRIRTVHRESRETYGSPRIWRTLRREGEPAGRHRIARIMRWEGIRGCSKQRFIRTATVRAAMPAAPNLVNGRFQAAAPNELWVADVTQLRTREGWLYLAIVLDIYSRKIVGSATAPHARQELALGALHQALTTRRPSPGLIHHSDRGGQYLSAEYQDRLDRHGVRCSMSRPYRSVDNAVAESFFHTLKTEWLYHFDFDTREEARLAIFDYVEIFYNRNRMHSAIGYRSPEEYETLRTVA
jgi:transposase InsO family protein